MATIIVGLSDYKSTLEMLLFRKQCIMTTRSLSRSLLFQHGLWEQILHLPNASLAGGKSLRDRLESAVRKSKLPELKEMPGGTQFNSIRGGRA